MRYSKLLHLLPALAVALATRAATGYALTDDDAHCSACTIYLPIILHAGPAPWWSWPCNTPRWDWPDGCDYSPVEPPPSPLPAPCIRTAYTQTVPNDDFLDILDTQLVIVIDHPEYPNYTTLDEQLVILRQQPASTWDVVDGDWWFKCGRDEAPLAWTVREILNTRSFAPADLAYNTPLPQPFLDLLADIGDIPGP